MDPSLETVKLRIDGNWSAQEFGEAFMSLSELYDVRLFLELLREDLNDARHFFSGLPDFYSVAPYRNRPLDIEKAIRYRLGLWYAKRPSLDAAYLSRLPEVLPREQRLIVNKISYASPGVSDLTGLGAIIGHLKDFTLKMLERHDTRMERKLKDERSALENEHLRLENAREYVSLCREAGYTESDHRALAAYVDSKQDPLIRLINQGKITGISGQ